jgi:hypothetical protein
MSENFVGEFCPFPRKLNRRERTKRNRERRAAGLPVNPARKPLKARPIILHGYGYGPMVSAARTFFEKDLLFDNE